MAEGTLPEGWEETVRQIARKVADRLFPGMKFPAEYDAVSAELVWEKRDFFDHHQENFENWCEAILTESDLLGRAVRGIARDVASQLIPKTQLAEDLEAESFGLVWEKRRHFDPAKGTFQAWCRTVLKRKAIDLLRRSVRRRTIDGGTGQGREEGAGSNKSFELATTADPRWEAGVRLAEFKEDLSRCLARLSPLEKVVWTVITGVWREIPDHFWRIWLEEADIDPPFPPGEWIGGASMGELAASLGCSVEAIRQRYYRANRKMRSCLDEKRERGSN